jgi:hypothetical protein
MDEGEIDVFARLRPPGEIASSTVTLRGEALFEYEGEDLFDGGEGLWELEGDAEWFRAPGE